MRIVENVKDKIGGKIIIGVILAQKTRGCAVKILIKDMPQKKRGHVFFVKVPAQPDLKFIDHLPAHPTGSEEIGRLLGK